MKKTLSWMVVGLLFSPAILRAETDFEDIEKRCKVDVISDAKAGSGRNSWALKCGYIKKLSAKQSFDDEGLYVTFSNAFAPTDENADCISGLHRLGTCILGCFALGQRLLFDGRLLSSEQAYAERLGLITSLGKDSDLLHMTFVQEPIASYVTGKHTGVIVEVQVADGKKLQVTPNHPMVKELGYIVRADQVSPGMKLMTQDGPQAVKAVASLPYDDMVWNVRPQSTATKANIHVAEGFLTGSVRFQNQWAHDFGRLYERLVVEISDF